MNLGPDDIDVWFRQSGRLDAQAMAAADASLSTDERTRAARFRRPEDWRDYVVAHDLLRRTLSRYAATAAADWRFKRTQRGRPFIEPPLPVPLYFSLSHTHGFVACAVGRDESLGLDVEQIRERLTTDDIGDVALTPAEIAAIDACPPTERTARLIELWTLKEAYLKATGRGLSDLVRQLSYTYTEDGVMIGAVPDEDRGPRWHVALFAPTGQTRLSVVVGRPGAHPQIRVRDDDEGDRAMPVMPLRVSR